MKLILGDNQFFGINHNNFSKGISDKEKFTSDDDIKAFINESLKVGLDGFMINSNIIGYRLLSRNKFPVNKEIHYSIPYPHKYAAIVNESGMISLLSYFLKNSSIWITIKCVSKFLFSRNLKYLLPVATSLEIPKNLPKNSIIYLQNILTDLIIGIGRIDILEYYIIQIKKMGYRAGLITLNPLTLDKHIQKSKILNQSNLVVCFNINNISFNVFPSKNAVEAYIKTQKKYKTMAMSIFASGGGDIKSSINYIKELEVDYVVFGSSKIDNIKNNFNLFKSD